MKEQPWTLAPRSRTAPHHPRGSRLQARSWSPFSLLEPFVAKVLVGLVMDAKVYLSRWGEAHKVNRLTFIFHAADPRAALSDSAPSPTWEPVAGKHTALGIVLL